jgi:membrane-bound serine protease (ClpP class)
VSTLLLILGIAGIGIELLVPGFGVPGIVGLAAFALYFLGHYIAGIAGMESMIFFIAGIILLLLEMFIPSFGILGILGAAGLLYGIVSAAYDTGNATRSLGIAAIVALAVIIVTAYIFRKRGIWNKFILSESLTKDKGFVPNELKEDLVGKEGITKSPLRPAGVAEIDGKRMDVVSPGDFVEPGRPVRVIAVDGTRILVEEIKSS